MPIIGPVERKYHWVKMIYITMYVVLTLGAVTMIYPMALMVSGSLKSEVDTLDMDPVPKYLFSDEVLYRKFVESKYGGQIMFYRQVYRAADQGWRQIVVPDDLLNDRIVDYYEQFRDEDVHLDWQVLAHGWGPSGLIFKNTRAYRQYLENEFSGSIDDLNNKKGTAYHSFLEICPPDDTELPSRRYQVSKEADFNEFKRTRPPQERILIDLDGFYSLYYVQPMYHTIENYNVIHQTRFKSFTEIYLDRTPPENSAMRKDWEYFVRNELNSTFVRIDPAYRKDAKAIVDWDLYLQKQVPLEAISVYGPRQAFEDYLHDRGLHDIPKDTFVDVVKRADYREFIQHKTDFRYDCMKRNYSAVLDYILLHGNGMINTVIYCVLAVVSQLLVNPLAAYALSRYRPPSTYKILLFCMATMAFPSAVTMIPSFLLLRNLNLLNTFAALILPSMANGYWIFLLKGFFDSLPRELYEAAEIDGAGEWRKFWTITMSLSKPILAVVALGAFTAAYSNFMFALIIIPDQKMWTLMVWIYQLQITSPQAIVYASLCLAAIPTFIVFVLTQNVIMRGIVVPVEK